ncbi:MAG: glycyl-radical enzyme activating protein [Clostridia bacterium]|nr:glycyl-radical enzyme activating protein [Clostridia bacterium]
MKALIFDIERNSFVDGPGIRTTVFFKGCNLKCRWCHNPESQSAKKEILFYKDKCTGCGRCKDLTTADANFFCLNDAKEICGKEYRVDEVLEEVIKDKPFYENSGGGVTFSGGECMLQIDFLLEILKKCKENGIHTAVDTAGHIPWESFDKILPYTDVFLYDIKVMESKIHEEYTGTGNERILENLSGLLKAKASVWVRIPVIPGVNDSEDEMKSLKSFFDLNGKPQKIELLPYHAMGTHKYSALGKTAEEFGIPDKSTLETFKRMFTSLKT